MPSTFSGIAPLATPRPRAGQLEALYVFGVHGHSQILLRLLDIFSRDPRRVGLWTLRQQREQIIQLRDFVFVALNGSWCRLEFSEACLAFTRRLIAR